MKVSRDGSRRYRARVSRDARSRARVVGLFVTMTMCFIGVGIVPVSATLTRGTVTLDSETTESVLGKFSVSKSGGSLDLKLSTAKSGWERGSHSLELLVMTDGEYFQWRDMKKKGSLCRDRNAVCSTRRAVALPHPGATHKAPGYEFFIDPESGDSYRFDLVSGNTTWMHPHQHHGQTEVITHRETTFSMELKETKKTQTRTKVYEREVTSSWFFVLSDCALEFYPAKPPALHFDLDLRSDSKHLPEELRGLGVIYGVAWVGMAGTFAAFVVEGYRRYQTSKSVHALVLIVIFAHACQLGSLVLEYMHITVLSMNGKGLRWRYTWFAADFASDMLQGVSEFVVEFVLLFLVCGWTTLSMTLGGLGESIFSSLESGGGAAAAAARPPMGSLNADGRQSTAALVASVLKSFFKINADDPTVKYRVSLIASALRSPVNMLKRGAETTIGVVILVFFSLVHLTLELASRKYNEDFEAFHDHDHWPGYALVFMRIAFAMLFIVAGGSTYATAKSQDVGLASFIRNLLVVGAAWLLAFPFVIFTAQSVPLIWKERYVAASCAFLQCTALTALGTLVVVDDSFKKLSSVGGGLGADPVRLGRHGFRAKVAID